MARCEKCGADLIGAAKFCSTCGAPVAASSPAPPPAKHGTEVMPSRPASPSSSRPPASAAPASATPTADPFAQTAFAGNSGAYGPPPKPIGALPDTSTPRPGAAPAQPVPSPPIAVSPLASSGVVPPSSRSVPFPRQPAPQPRAAGAYPAPAPAPAPAPQPGAWGARAPTAFGPGSRVLVQWADGKRYPGTVQRATGAQYLVVFEDGQQRWVDVKFLSSVR